MVHYIYLEAFLTQHSYTFHICFTVNQVWSLSEVRPLFQIDHLVFYISSLWFILRFYLQFVYILSYLLYYTWIGSFIFHMPYSSIHYLKTATARRVYLSFLLFNVFQQTK